MKYNGNIFLKFEIPTVWGLRKMGQLEQLEELSSVEESLSEELSSELPKVHNKILLINKEIL